MDELLLLASFAVILAGALLFTNAVEWAGHRLELGEGATGSVLAAVGTAMPETLIPIVAIIGGAEGSEDVAVGAIIGAPFMLATIAMALVGISALIYRGRREQGPELDADTETLDRDLLFFLVFFAVGVALGLGAPEALQIPLAILYVLAYGLYVRGRSAGAARCRTRGDRRAVHGPNPGDEPPTGRSCCSCWSASERSSAAPICSSRSCSRVAEQLGVEPLVLSLVLAPLATELPEKANSFFWIRDGKDSLALGNITGAMVFQSTIPIAVGLAFTDWDLDRFAVMSGALGLVGGAIAYWTLRLRRRFELPAVAAWIALFATFIVYVVLA